MSSHPTYAAWLIFSGALAIILGVIIFRKRPASGALALSGSLFAVTLWAWAYAGLWLDVPAHKVYWANLAIVGVAAAPTFGLILVLQFTGRSKLLTNRFLAVLAIVPVMTIAIAWTDGLHNLFYGAGAVAEIAAFGELGPWLAFYVLYAYSLNIIGVYFLGRAFVNGSGLYRAQLGIVMVGMLFPWLANVLAISKFNPWPGLDIGPIAFIINGALLSYGIFFYRIMDLVPVSRDVLVENLEDGILVMDLQGRIVDANPRALELIGLSESPIGQGVESVFSRWSNSVERYDLMRGHFQIFQEHGPYHFLDVRILPINSASGAALGHIAALRDISTEVQATEKARVFLHVVDQNPGAIFITDPEGRIEYLNMKLVELSGYSLTEVIGKTSRLFKSGEMPEQTYTEMWETVLGGNIWEGDLLNRRKDGALYWVHELIAPVKDEAGVITHFIATEQDITDQKHTESELRVANMRLQLQLTEIENLHNQLREESIRDGLTRLFNRRYMEETLEREIQIAQRRPAPISVVMMDVDTFKTINDTFGHQAGDTVLQTLGTLLMENTRASDVACRYGGDEMVVVLSGATSEEALARAEEWRLAFSQLEIIFGLHALKNTLSLGVATFPEHGRNPIELLGAADKALYMAKAQRNSARLYEPLPAVSEHTQPVELRNGRRLGGLAE